jgi:N-acetylglutamate synthase-like GNAT family acetyltransferase
MTVRKPGAGDILKALELARTLGLDYPEMEKDKLWIAEEAGRVVGVVALRTHPDCRELCSLGVDPGFRNLGAGRALVEAVMTEAPGEVHLGTTVPGYFEKLGFQPAAPVPGSLAAKRSSAWCEGCDIDRCTVMVRVKT